MPLPLHNGIVGYMSDIVQEGMPVLRETAKPVPDELFGTPKLKKIIAEMRESLDSEQDGVALAAPQIGIGYRIFIVRYDRTLPPDKNDSTENKSDVGVYINPKILKTSRKRAKMEEGCLSVRGIYGHTRRYERSTVSAQDENGKHFTRGAGGILSQIFQHEIDHLNGILFIDYASDLYEFVPNEKDSGE